MIERTAVGPEVSKAIAVALAYRDFSGWRRKERDGIYRFVFELELGSGYSLYAYPEPDFIVGPMTFDILYDGAYMLCSRGTFVSMAGCCLRLKGDDAWASLFLDRTTSLYEYARSMKDSVCKKRIMSKICDKDFPTDIYYSESSYVGCKNKEKKRKSFSWDFKKNLMKATFMQDFTGIESYTEKYRILEAGLEFEFTDSGDEMYSTRYRISVYGGGFGAGPVDFWFKGTLTRDSDGILIRGDSASLTIPISKGEMKKFRKETGFPTPEEYLAEHPFVSYKHYTEKYSDQIPGFTAEDEDRW